MLLSSSLFLQKKKKVEEVPRRPEEGMVRQEAADVHVPSTSFFHVLLDLFECLCPG